MEEWHYAHLVIVILLTGPLSSESSNEEQDMLNQLYNKKDTSRLICQIPLESHLDGITLQLANS